MKFEIIEKKSQNQKRDSIPIWEKIKQKVSIPEIYPKTLNNNNRGDCCNHQNTKSASFQYYPETKSWSCYSCGVGGDVIKLYSYIHNLNQNHTIKEMCENYNIEFEAYDKEYYKTYEEIKEIFKEFMEKCHNNLNFKQDYKKDLMNRRGFTLETIELFKIGLFDDSIKKYIENKYPKKLLQETGFLSEKGNWIIGKRIIYPYLNQNNEPMYFIFRLIDFEPDFRPKDKYVKQRKTDYVKEIPFGLNSIYSLKKKPLIITEGITDAISVIQAKYPCLSPVTTRIKKTDIEKMITYCKRFEKVIVINDNEEFKKNNDGEIKNSGLEGSIDTIKVLIPNKINAYIGIIPNPKKLEKIDLDDYLKTDGEKKLIELVESSIEGLEFFINNLNDFNYSTNDIKDILELLPLDDVVKRKRIYTKIKRITNGELNFKDLDIIWDQIITERKEHQENELVSKAEEEKKDDQKKEIPKELREKVNKFLNSEEKFKVVNDVLEFDIVGEDNNKQLLFILLLGAYFNMHQITLLIGESSGGKTYIVEKVIELFPNEDVFTITGASAKAIHYREWNERILFFNEVQRNYEIIESLKDFGDQGIKYIVTIKDTNGNLTTREITIGLMSIVATTTKENINNELMNRAWRLEPDLSKEQSKKIVKETFGKVANGFEALRKEREKKEKQNLIKIAFQIVKEEYNFDRVDIPYINVLNDILNYDFEKIRRDKDKLIYLIKIITAYNFKIREFYEFNNYRILLAHPNDLIVAMEYGHEIFRYISRNLTPEKVKITDTILNMTSKKEKWFTTNQIFKKFKEKVGYTKQKKSFTRLLKALCDDNYLTSKKEGRSNKYKLEGKIEPIVKDFNLIDKVDEALDIYEERVDNLIKNENVKFNEKGILLKEIQDISLE
jgi:hypothetical protein